MHKKCAVTAFKWQARGGQSRLGYSRSNFQAKNFGIFNGWPPSCVIFFIQPSQLYFSGGNYIGDKHGAQAHLFD
jgi:hypothetical protein